MVWEKGLYALADAAANMLRDRDIQRLNPLFVIAGGGPEQPGLEKHLRLLGLTDSFRLLGSVPYPLLPAVHRIADVFVLPSISTRTVLEQFGIALIEAMATSTPVIATHCGAIDEVVGDAGVLVQPNDHFRLADALRELCLSPERRRELGARGRARLLEHFTAQKISDKLASGYARVLGAEQSPATGHGH
jgi:glycosyltransferase involved in cell wall biosynthesis